MNNWIDFFFKMQKIDLCIREKATCKTNYKKVNQFIFFPLEREEATSNG